MTQDDYTLVNSQVRALIADEPDVLACAANFVGLLFNSIEDINWQRTRSTGHRNTMRYFLRITVR